MVVGTQKEMCAHIVKIELVLGKSDNVIANLFLLIQRFGDELVYILNNMLPSRWGLGRRQQSHWIQSAMKHGSLPDESERASQWGFFVNELNQETTSCQRSNAVWPSISLSVG